MTNLVFLLEEPSAKVLLEGLLPQLLPAEVAPKYLTFEGKSDLERNIAKKLGGWLAPATHFVVLRDQDSHPDCKQVKARLLAEVEKSSRPALVRVACRALEAWVAGDLEAVAKAFERPDVARHAAKEKFRDPDKLGSPVDELRSLIPGYQKIDGARRVGPLLDPARNRSQSFRAFCAGLKRLFDERK